MTAEHPVPALTRSTQYAQEIGRGFLDSALLISMKWHGIRNPAVKWALVLSAFVLAGGVLIAINLGYVIKVMALQGNDTAAGVFALSWLSSLQRNEIGDIGAITLGGALAAAVFAPFTGSSTLSLVPVEDLHGIRLNRLHRFFDSFLTNCISGIGLLQLIALTAITSVLSLDSSRGPALIVTWTLWIFVVLLATTIGWTLEWSLRKYGIKMRYRVAGFILTGLGIAVWFDPDHGRTVFGLGKVYTDMMESASNGTVQGFLTGFLPAVGLVLIALFTGLLATRYALAHPTPNTLNSKDRRPHKTSTNITTLSTRLLLDTLWRTPEVRRPILAVLVVGIPGLMLADMTENLETALLLAVPLAVALAAGVNLFAVFGPGMSWLASQPRVLTGVFTAAAWTQFLTTIAVMMTLWLSSYVVGKTTLEVGVRLLAGSVIAGALATIMSMELSIRKPIRARLSGRGDALVPPITALAYMFWLIFFACIPAILLEGAYPQLRLFASVFIVGLFLVITRSQRNRFANPAIRSKIVSEVAAT